MVLKRVIGLIFAGGLIFSAAAADFVIRIAPPRVVAQQRNRAPGPGFVWVKGYQNWDGQGYAWVPGRWVQPPRPRARWTAHKWTRQRNGNWVLIEGRWR